MTEIHIKQENKPDTVAMIRFQVKLMGINEQMTLEIYTMQSINDVKAKIQLEKFIPIENIDLFYRGVQLHNNGTLSSYNIGNGATLYAVFHAKDAMRLIVFIKKDNRTVKLRVKEWYTIKDVKIMLESMVEVPVEKQRLYLHMEKDLANSEPLTSLRMSEGDLLTMFYELQISLGNRPNRQLEVEETDTVGYVMELLGIDILEYLTFNERQLYSRHMLKYYNLKNGDVLDHEHVYVPSSPLYVRQG